MENLDQAEDSIKAKLAHEIYGAVGKINPESDLLFVLGSYRDTLNDVETLMRLRHWNSTHVATRGEDPQPEAPLIPRGIA
ncbi:hypothetical protein [Mesorhizobium sp. IMUNJ 23232]|uniref:hypothetical protein n=1 Tax=Mesorhizobium sp. IMUNJ 23232 TaxID=3376064 RepID=UPI0037A9B3A6